MEYNGRAMTILNLYYAGASHYVAHLNRHATREALLVVLPEGVMVARGEKVELEISFASEEPGGRLATEVAMVTPTGGAVFKLEDALDGMILAGGATASTRAEPPVVSQVPDSVTVMEIVMDDEEPEPVEVPERVVEGPDLDADGPDDAVEPDLDAEEPAPDEATGAADEEPERELTALEKIAKRKSGPLSWPADKLQAEWTALPMSDRVRVARYGDRSGRALVARQQDKNLHAVLLSNPKLSPTEVAMLVGKSGLDAVLVKRIASNREWTSRKAVAKALISNPRLPHPQALRLLHGMTEGDLRQLARSSNLRSSMRQAVGKQLKQLETRRRGKR